MSNAELFKKVFGIYAEEFWAYPEEKMLDWLTSNVPDTNVGDIISRQAEIDAVRSYYDEIYGDPLSIEERIEALPSAQAERTCVNCGRTANNGGWYADGRTRCPIEEHYALPKDGYCHLWEKRNVTDDDYPERRTDGRD